MDGRTIAPALLWMAEQWCQLPFTQKVYPSDANFLLVKMENARKIYEFLAVRGIIVRDRSKVILCDDCLRITIGTGDENKQLLAALKLYKA